MVNVPVIAKRELNTYFLSPISYVVLTGFALAHGIVFALALQPQVDVARVVQWVFGGTLFFLFLPAMPLLTMRLLSEEANRGTVETLMTTPVAEVEVVLGKFVAALIFAAVMLAPVVLEVAFAAMIAPMDMGPVLSGFLGLFLLTAQFTAIGLVCSALTKTQTASAIIAFVILLGLCFLWFVAGDATAVSFHVLRYMAPPTHYFTFTKGVVDTRDLAYFAITTATFVFLTVKALELRKWR